MLSTNNHDHGPQSAIDRLQSAAFEFVIGGDSCQQRQKSSLAALAEHQRDGKHWRFPGLHNDRNGPRPLKRPMLMANRWSHHAGKWQAATPAAIKYSLCSEVEECLGVAHSRSARANPKWGPKGPELLAPSLERPRRQRRSRAVRRLRPR